MSDDLHGAQPVEDVEDIPTLTDIVVPGRLRAEPPPAPSPTPADFDIEFDQRSALTTPRAVDEVVEDPWPHPAPPAAIDDDLPLPWADERPAPDRPPQADDVADEHASAAEPAVPWHAPVPQSPEPAEPPAATPDVEALLGAWLNDVAAALEPRIDAELALAGQRLRAALREELDARLRDLLAASPPKT
jgi:hypothetical protein